MVLAAQEMMGKCQLLLSLVQVRTKASPRMQRRPTPSGLRQEANCQRPPRSTSARSTSVLALQQAAGHPTAPQPHTTCIAAWLL